jgi:hypothetical protein
MQRVMTFASYSRKVTIIPRPEMRRSFRYFVTTNPGNTDSCFTASSGVREAKAAAPTIGFITFSEEGEIMANSGLIGSSERFQAVLDDVRIVAPAECAVLVQGETGTGKEVIARAIHDSGPRQSGPFVASTARQFLAPYWRANSSAMKEVLSRGLSHRPSGTFRPRMEARCFWTRLETCLWSYNRNFCECCRSSNTNGWEAVAPCVPMCELSQPQIKIFRRWWKRKPSVLISIID